jgi:hypothetical protein
MPARGGLASAPSQAPCGPHPPLLPNRPVPLLPPGHAGPLRTLAPHLLRVLSGAFGFAVALAAQAEGTTVSRGG